jgi:hypothetical protein
MASPAANARAARLLNLCDKGQQRYPISNLFPMALSGAFYLTGRGCRTGNYVMQHENIVLCREYNAVYWLGSAAAGDEQRSN